MGTATKLFNKHLPEDTCLAMYKSLSYPDQVALYEDRIDDLSPRAKQIIKPAAEIANNKEFVQPQLAAQQKELQQPTHGWRGDLEDLASVIPGALTGLARGTADLVNLPGNLINQVTGSHIPQLISKPGNVSQLLGAIQGTSGVPDNPSAEALGSFIPSMLGGEGAVAELAPKASQIADKVLPNIGGLAGKVASGTASAAGKVAPELAGMTAYGASTNQDNPLGGALLGATMGLGGAGAGRLMGKASSPIAKLFAKHISDPLAIRAQEVLSKATGKAPDIEDILGKAYGNAADKIYGREADDASEGVKGWNETLEPIAQKADEAGEFNSDDYVKKANDILSELEPKYNDVSLRDKYAPSINFLKQQIDSPPKTYQEAMIRNEAINSLPSKWSKTDTGKTEAAKKVSNIMRDALNDQVSKNALENDANKAFADAWNQKKKDYAFLKSFSGLPAGGKIAFKKPIADLIGRNPSEDIRKFYLPTSKKMGTDVMQHLANLVGDKKLAANALKKNYMDGAYVAGEFEPQKAIGLYNKLSDKQKKFMFNNEENELFSKAAKFKQIGKKSLLSAILKHLSGTTLGAGIGGLYGHEVGISPWKSAALGAALTGGGIPSALYGLSRMAPEKGGLDALENMARGKSSFSKGTLPLAKLALIANQN
jgi:hypothetical protein